MVKTDTKKYVQDNIIAPSTKPSSFKLASAASKATVVMGPNNVSLHRTPLYATFPGFSLPPSQLFKGITVQSSVLSRARAISLWIPAAIFIAWWAVPGSNYVIKKALYGAEE
jgi:hypothetical protein